MNIELKNGSKWTLNTAYNGDCLEFMQSLPDKCIDLVLTDPPYGINAGAMNLGFSATSKIEKSEWDSEIPSDEIFHEIFRVSKNQIIWGGNYFNLPPSRCFIVWDKMDSMYNRSFAECEQAWVSIDGTAKMFKFSPCNMPDKKIHKTQKPLKLFKWCLEKYSKPGNLIFDPFLGSFTTAVACHSHGLNWIGCEKDLDYFKAGTERYDTECLQGLLEF